jgi:glucose-1-phosphate adenylyltransferase
MYPPARDSLAVVLAGGRGGRLGPLTDHECKPALPFGACWRSIDFTLSNCINSGIRTIGVPTQYEAVSVARHLERTWLPIARQHGASIIEWRAGRGEASEAYVGTADAVYKNWPRITRSNARYVLVLAGDHVYKMDYGAMLDQHVARDADVTVGCVEVGVAEARQFGVISVDSSGRITRFDEKPANPVGIPGDLRHALGSMGIYVFSTAFLERVLHDDAGSAESVHDFGHNIIPTIIDKARVFSFPFRRGAPVGDGYWRDIGTPSAYWQASMELLDGESPIVRSQSSWPILTTTPNASCTRPTNDTDAPLRRNAIIAADCSIEGAFVIHSVLGRGVHVGAHSCVRDSVLLPGALVGRNCYLDCVIVAAGCEVPDSTVIGQPSALRTGTSAKGVEPIIVTPESCAAHNRWRHIRQHEERQERYA